MNILVLNGSPRKNGNVAKALKKETEKIQMKYKNSQIIWKNLSDLNFDFCKGCMACRSKMNCILQPDDAHTIAEEIKAKGNFSDLSFINDWFDNSSQPRVYYDNWLEEEPAIVGYQGDSFDWNLIK